MKILIIGGANGGLNLGDDAMFEALVFGIRKHFKNNITIISDGEKGWHHKEVDKVLRPLHQSLNIRKVGRAIVFLKYLSSGLASRMYRHVKMPFPDRIMNSYIKEIKDCDLIVYAGMGAMNDHYKFQGIIARAIISRIAKVFRKRIIFSGQGVGPLNVESNRKMVTELLKNVECVFVRDKTGSKKSLKACEYDDKNIVEWVDDAFYMHVSEKDRLEASILLKKLSLKEDEFIIVNMHKWNETIMQELFDVIYSAITSTRKNVLLMPNYYTGKLDDRKALAEFHEYILRRNPTIASRIIVQDRIITPQVSRAITAKAYATIATRYHMGVFSLSEGKPCILLSTDNAYYVQKMSGALKWYGLEKYYVHHSNISDFIGTFDDLGKNYKSVCKNISDNNKLFEKTGYKALRYIIHVLEGKIL